MASPTHERPFASPVLGGVVVWDDFEPYWHRLVNGICDEMGGRTFCRLAGTSLAVYDNS